jgi:hypothetical protein
MSNYDSNPNRQRSYQHPNTYKSRVNKPNQSMRNAPWASQFNSDQYKQYQSYQQTNPQEIQKDTINSRISGHHTSHPQMRQKSHQYVPRLQTLNNEIFERRVQNPTYNMRRNYGLQNNFNQNSRIMPASIGETKQGPNKIGMKQHSDFMNNKSEAYTFKSKKDDLNDRISSFGMRATAQQSMPIHDFNPYLDMRPQNTSDLQ